MNKKSKYLFFTIIIALFTITIELTYLSSFKSLTKKDIEDKNILVSSLGLPDLAISTEAMYIRHRSLSDTFSIFKEGPELREYFPTTFIYSHSHILNNTPSKIINEK